MDELTSVDPNWEPPVCWYEPVFAPQALKSAVEDLEKNGGLGAANAHEWWTSGIFVDHYDKGEEQDNFDLNSPTNNPAQGYKNYNLGKDGSSGAAWSARATRTTSGHGTAAASCSGRTPARSRTTSTPRRRRRSPRTPTTRSKSPRRTWS